jgi:hypothetical protein
MRIRQARFTFDDSSLSRDRARAVATLALRRISIGIRRSPVGGITVGGIGVRIARTAAMADARIAHDTAQAVLDRLARPDLED